MNKIMNKIKKMLYVVLIVGFLLYPIQAFSDGFGNSNNNIISVVNFKNFTREQKIDFLKKEIKILAKIIEIKINQLVEKQKKIKIKDVKKEKEKEKEEKGNEIKKNKEDKKNDKKDNKVNKNKKSRFLRHKGPYKNSNFSNSKKKKNKTKKIKSISNNFYYPYKENDLKYKYKPILGNHWSGGSAKWAYDAPLKEGGLVFASADGVVKYIKEDSDIYGCSNKYNGKANYVVLDHKKEKKETLYLHLKKDSISKNKIKIGQKIKKGQIIGEVGKSGYICGVHLHFQVQKRCKTWWCDSLPVQIRK